LLREREELTVTQEVQKTQLQRASYTIDFYIEGDHRLAIKFEDIDKHSVLIDGIRVAAIEHVLALAIDKAISRYGSTESTYEQDGVVRIV
jgi:hypothetical protein